MRIIFVLLIFMLTAACSSDLMHRGGAYYFSSVNQETTVPMKLLHTGDIGGLPLLEVQLGGQKGWWLLDTGATENIISPQLVKTLKLKEKSKQKINFIGGEKVSSIYQLGTLKIGDLVLEGQSAVALDIAEIKPTGDVLSGILGMPALRQLVVGIDMPAKSIHLASSVIKPHPHANIPLIFKNGLPFVRLDFASGNGYFLLDTGNAGALVVFLSPSIKEKLQASRLATVTVDELGGQVSTRLGLVPEVKIGNFSVKNVPVSVPLVGAQGFTAFGIDGSVGNALFAEAVLEMDFPNKYLSIKYPSDDYMVSGGFGFLLEKGSNRIATVLLGSSADQHGLQPRDKLIAINGHDMRNEPSAALWEKLSALSSVNFKVERGGEVLTIPLERTAFLPQLKF